MVTSYPAISYPIHYRHTIALVGSTEHATRVNIGADSGVDVTIVTATRSAGDPANAMLVIAAYETNAPNGSILYKIKQAGTTSPPTVIAFRSAASAIGSSATTITIAKPSGVAEDDQLIAAIGKPGSPLATVTPPSGWTLIRSMTSNFLNIYRRTAGASEPSTYTWTFSASVNSAGGIQAFENVDPDDPIHIENGQNTASGTAHATPDVTPTIPDTVIVTAHGLLENSSFTAPSGMTEAYDVPNSGLSTTAGYYEANPDAGATGTKTATSANSATGSAHILCLKPVGGSQTTTLASETIAGIASTPLLYHTLHALFLPASTSSTVYTLTMSPATAGANNLVREATIRVVEVTI
jgi:hypothetical protein